VVASSFFKQGMRIFPFAPVIIALRRSAALNRVAGFWERFDKKWDLINRSTIIVRADSSLIGGISRYKVYVNGYIVYTRVPSGNYRLVFREFDQHKPDRLESNVLEFNLGEGEQITIWASICGSDLRLAFD
jgi:hypothetical protein